MKHIVKFGFVGVLCAALQLAILKGIVVVFSIHEPIGENAANMVAFIISAQANFFLSYFFTWSDRRDSIESLNIVFKKMLSFNTMVLFTLFVNQATFAATNIIFPVEIAGVCGIIAASAVNFVVSRNLVFRSATSTN